MKNNLQSNDPTPDGTRAWLPDLIYTQGKFESGLAVVCNSDGQIAGIVPATELDCEVIRLANRAVLPGLINGHSHAFQRVIRGRTEYRSAQNDSFWTWREMMYAAATRLSPEDIYIASQMAFLEMALSGITAVGEFHYLHNAPDGTRYEDPNLLAKQVIAAARDVGLRIGLLRVAYVRSGFNSPPNPRQARFIEDDPKRFLEDLEALHDHLGDRSSAWIGIAPHSVRAVPLEYLQEIVQHANRRRYPVHMHVSEQPAENQACHEEYGRTPIGLLSTEGILCERFTAVHAVHVTVEDIRDLASAGAMVCACPTTERNLGDGIVPVDLLFQGGIAVSLGTDSQAQIDLLEDARELEYHLRLKKMERAVLASLGEGMDSLAHVLLASATVCGARSIGFDGGELANGRPADFFSIDLNNPSIAGSTRESLLPNIVFALDRAAVRDVVVGGKAIVSDGRHPHSEAIIESFGRLQDRLWS